MILYNVTVIIEESIDQQWLPWIQEQHIPDVTLTGMFTSVRLLKVIDSPNEGITYCIQHIAENMDKYTIYKEKYADAFHSEREEKFGTSFVSFSTLMEFI